MMTEVILCIGANCGQREKSVSEAVEWLETFIQVIAKSKVYETPCALNIPESTYLNCVIKAIVSQSAEHLEKQLKEYEERNGRNDDCRRIGEVPIDIDIVMADGKILKEWDYRQKFFQLGYTQIF